MTSKSRKALGLGLALLGAAGMVGCRNHMPHSLTWPGGGDITPSHAKPPEGGYYTNWDPYAVEIELTPVEDVNPVRTQHIMIATVKDKNGKALPNRRVEWIINDGSVGDIVEVDESGWRNSRGYKVDNHYAVSHTNNFKHVLDRGNSDPADDISLTEGQTWCVITSPIEGTTNITAYAPGIYDWSKHKAFAIKHWYDVHWEWPPAATNPIGTSHEFVTKITKYSDGTPLAGYIVTYKLADGPAGTFEPGGGNTATVTTDAAGLAKITLRQAAPAEGTNNVDIDVMRPENVQCCKPAVHIASGRTSKTWIGPKISIDKECTPAAMVGETVNYTIVVGNPSQVDATNVVVTDAIPAGIQYVSSTPAGQASGASVTWSLGTVKPGQPVSIAVQAKATQVGKFENCAEVRADYNLNARDCCVTVVTSPKLQISKTCTKEITTCDTIEYVITVRNEGDGAAKNVRVSDQLPAGVVTSDGKTAMDAVVGDLGPGESKEIRFTAKAAKPGTYNNTVRATGDAGLTAEASCTTKVTQPVLDVQKTGPKERYIGRPAEYTITVSNKGDTVAKGTVLTDPIPAGMQFTSASDGGALSGNVVTWNLGDMAPGASKTVKLSLKAITAGKVVNTATAKAICTEAQATTEGENKGVPAVLLEVIDISDPIEIGAQETYEITVTNQGSAADTNIVIKIEIPAEMEFVNAAGPTQGTASGKSVTFAPLPSLAPKAKAVYKLVTKGTKAADVRLKVSMSTDQTGNVPVEETESTHVYE
ncbi:MAG: DUF11 domain-containing protein [Planctomycetes bacterium]|nr:DUF11 domain-containing protein [Planctomycetota bacterium]